MLNKVSMKHTQNNQLSTLMLVTIGVTALLSALFWAQNVSAQEHHASSQTQYSVNAEQYEAQEESTKQIIPSNAKASLIETLESIQQHQVQQGHFEQQRWLAVLDKPLISNGEFSAIKNQSLIWSISEPFAIRYEFDGKQLKQTEFNETRTLGLRDDPMLFGFFSFFFDLLNGKHEALESYFSLESTIRIEQAEHIILKPEKLQLKKAFSRLHIVIENKSLIRVEIIENEQDKVILNFNYAVLRQ